MIQKHFFAAFIAYLIVSFQLSATDLEATKELTESINHAWVYVASALKDEKDVVQLARVCKQTHEATQNLGSWEGVAQKYKIQPRQVRRYLELLSKYRGQDEIDLGKDGLYRLYGLCGGAFSAFVMPYSYTRAVPSFKLLGRLIEPSSIHRYIKVNDYVRVKVEDEERQISWYEELNIVKPMEISLRLKSFELEKLFVTRTTELPEQK